MALKDELKDFPRFMRGFGGKEIIVILLNFDWNKDYPVFNDEHNRTKYFIIPAFFPKQDNIKNISCNGVRGGFKLSKTCLKPLQEALQGYDDKPCNHTLIGCYDDKTKSYDIKRVEGNFVDTKKDIKMSWEKNENEKRITKNNNWY